MENNLNNMTNSIICDDIYAEETDRSLKTLKRFSEAWLDSTSSCDSVIFHYADSDFYFYRYAISRQEKATEPLLTNILYRVMERYGLSYEAPEDIRNAPFVFTLIENNRRIGFRYEDFGLDDDVNQIIQDCNLDEAIILRAWLSGKAEEWIDRENSRFINDGVKLKSVLLETFFKQYFGADEYNSFLSHINDFLQKAKDITGYKSIKFLSTMNLAMLKLFEEKELIRFDYNSYTYQIIDRTNENVQKYLNRLSRPFSPEFKSKMNNNYLSRNLYKAMIGGKEFAESFITSEWLYLSLKGKKNFDFTSVISGYLKSIEQLLYSIVMINVDNNCKISMNNEKSRSVINNNVVTYKWDKSLNSMVETPSNSNAPRKYIDFTSAQKQYMDSSIGTFEYFIKNNPHILEDRNQAKLITDMISCFRIECRNGYFHTHNLYDWDTVEKTRSNAIYLYYVLLGGCIIPDDKIGELGIQAEEEFDSLCKRIRDFNHYNALFVFEYESGKKLNVVYDFINNTAEYNDDGVEHYESLLFYDVGEFSDDTYEKLDEGIYEDKKVYLTRCNLPERIYGVHRDHSMEVIPY